MLVPVLKYTTSDEDQKYGRKRLVRRFGKIPLASRYRHLKNNKESLKNKIKNNKLCSIVCIYIIFNWRN